MSCSNCIPAESDHAHTASPESDAKNIWRFAFCALFTAPLLLHMVVPIEFLHMPMTQLALSTPVVIVGLFYFLPGAIRSLLRFYPNMDVLISIGFVSAYVYSIAGMVIGHAHEYLFFETAASIVCYTLLGNLIEHRANLKTTTSIAELLQLRPPTAKKITGSGALKSITQIETSEVKLGYVLQAVTGDTFAADGTITAGQALVNESIVTGESVPVEKAVGDLVLSGTVIEQGTVEFAVTVDTEHSMLAEIIRTVKHAQDAKPNIQRIGDSVSAVFVPTVLTIATITFCVSFFLISLPLAQAMLRAIAVLVVACPCAMGLATPTAVMVAIGRAAKKGLLIKGGDILERLATVKTFVFDKTGTITSGEFVVDTMVVSADCPEELKAKIPALISSLESFSTHPIARSLTKAFGNQEKIEFSNITEEKGLSIRGTLTDGTIYTIGSVKILPMDLQANTANKHFDLFLLRNGTVVTSLSIKDQLRTDAKQTINTLREAGLSLILLSGDRNEKCAQVANVVHFDEVVSEQSPAQKLEKIKVLQQHQAVAFVGDGVNDAPSLSAASVGISFGEASGAAIASASAVLLSHDLSKVVEAFTLAQKTVSIIKQNLFWAFFYNILMIPLAASGHLAPSIAALCMGLSDVFVIGNSLRLKTIRLTAK